MTKRHITALLIIAVITISLALPLSAGADVLIEPGNDFYERHVNELVSLRRDFYVNSRSGSLMVEYAPGSGVEVTTLENGEIIHIISTYSHNGKIWGVTDIEKPGRPYREAFRGWVPIDELLVVYDSISFEEDNSTKLYNYTGNFDALNDISELVVWKWPGSGIIITVLDEERLAGLSIIDFLSYRDERSAYNDREGRLWVALPIIIKQWICLSDPENRDIPAFNPEPAPRLWKPGDEHQGNTWWRSLPALIIILVVVLAAATAVLIRVFLRKKKADE